MFTEVSPRIQTRDGAASTFTKQKWVSITIQSPSLAGTQSVVFYSEGGHACLKKDGYVPKYMCST
jgi:hypothetical protein